MRIFSADGDFCLVAPRMAIVMAPISTAAAIGMNTLRSRLAFRAGFSPSTSPGMDDRVVCVDRKPWAGRMVSAAASVCASAEATMPDRPQANVVDLGIRARRARRQPSIRTGRKGSWPRLAGPRARDPVETVGLSLLRRCGGSVMWRTKMSPTPSLTKGTWPQTIS